MANETCYEAVYLASSVMNRLLPLQLVNESSLPLFFSLYSWIEWWMKCYEAILPQSIVNERCYEPVMNRTSHELTATNTEADSKIKRGYLFFCIEYHKYCHQMKWKHQYFHECEAQVKIWMFSLHEMKFLWYSLKKNKFSFYFIVYMSMRISDVISNVTTQNMNVTASTLSA